MSMLCAKEIASWAKKPNPNYNTHIGQSSTQPRMHENIIIMLENAMHEHVGINHQHLCWFLDPLKHNWINLRISQVDT